MKAKHKYLSLFIYLCLSVNSIVAYAQEPNYGAPGDIPYSSSIAPKVSLKDVRELEASDKDSALKIIKTHLATSLDKDYNDWLFEYIFTIGSLYNDTGDYEQAKNMFLQALVQSKQTTAPAYYGSRALSNIGNALSYQSNFEEAVKYYYRAIVTAESTPDAISYVGTTYNNMATVLLSMKQFRNALYYLKKAEAINLRLKNYRRLSAAYNNIGVVYFEQKKYDSSLYYSLKALKVAREYKHGQSEVTALLNLGELYQEMNQPSKAIPYLLDIYKVKQNINPYYKDVQTPLQLGRAYTSLKDYASAEKYLSESLRQTNRLNNIEYQKEVHQYLSELYEETKNYGKALYHHKEFMRYNDTMLNKEKTAAVNQYEVQYRTAQKDKDIMAKQLLIKEQEHKIGYKNIVIIGTVAGIVVLATLLIGLIQRYRHKQKLQDEKIKVLQKDQQIGNLKAVMMGEEKERTRIARELHDGVGGTLAAVKMNFMAVQRSFSFLNGTEDFKDGMAMLDTMSNELRQAAHNLMPEMIVQHGLAESVSRYCDQIRKGRSLPIELQIYGTFTELDNFFTVSAYRIIQELIHNIVRHAQATHAIVQLSCHDHLLSVVVEDNGIGFDPDLALKGLGLKNMRARVDSLNGNITIESIKNKGTAIYLEFDISAQPKAVTT